MRAHFFILFLSMSSLSFSSVGRMYYGEFLGHVHKNMSKDSESLTVIQCSQSLKVLKEENTFQEWSYVQVGEDKGYVQTKFLVSKKPICLQEKYPEFYKNLNLDITDMYYWGKLYDQYFMGKSKIK